MSLLISVRRRKPSKVHYSQYILTENKPEKNEPVPQVPRQPEPVSK